MSVWKFDIFSENIWRKKNLIGVYDVGILFFSLPYLRPESGHSDQNCLFTAYCPGTLHTRNTYFQNNRNRSRPKKKIFIKKKPQLTWLGQVLRYWSNNSLGSPAVNFSSVCKRIHFLNDSMVIVSVELQLLPEARLLIQPLHQRRQANDWSWAEQHCPHFVPVKNNFLILTEDWY